MKTSGCPRTPTVCWSRGTRGGCSRAKAEPDGHVSPRNRGGEDRRRLGRAGSEQSARGLVDPTPLDHLRVLIANERKDRLSLVAPIVIALGHEVIAREIDVSDVGRHRPRTARCCAGRTRREFCACARADRQDRSRSCLPCDRAPPRARPEFRYGSVKARRVRPHLRRRRRGLAEFHRYRPATFAEYQDLQGAFGRRATIERAKGILMERHSIDEDAAFQMCANAHASTTAS